MADYAVLYYTVQFRKAAAFLLYTVFTHVDRIWQK